MSQVSAVFNAIRVDIFSLLFQRAVSCSSFVSCSVTVIYFCHFLTERFHGTISAFCCCINAVSVVTTFSKKCLFTTGELPGLPLTSLGKYVLKHHFQWTDASDVSGLEV